MAQSNVYSLNVVGYINVSYTNRFQMVANQLDLDGTGTNNTVQTVFSTNVPGLTTVYTFTPGSGYASATLIGTRSLGECLPGVLSLSVAAKGNLAAQIAGIIEAQARLTVTPPTLAGNIQIATEILASLQAAVAIGLPTVDFQFAALAEVLAALQAQLAAIVDLRLGELGVSLYTYDGPQVGTSTQGIVPPGVSPSQDSGALVLSAVAPGTRAALKALAGLI